MHLAQKGRGRALAAVWSASDAPVLAYMDVDLSTDLGGLLPLVAPLISGHSRRRDRQPARPRRPGGPRAQARVHLPQLQPHPPGPCSHVRFSDAQCGFKAVRRDAAEQLLPLVEDTGWFFDTELLVLAERAGLRIHEVPVDWVDYPTDASTSSPPPSPTSRAWPGCSVAWRVAASRSRGSAPGSAGPPWPPERRQTGTPSP